MSDFNYKKAILHGDGSIESFAVANVGTDRQEYDREDHSAEAVLKDILAKLTPRQKMILRGREAWIGYISDDGTPSMQPTLHAKTRSMETADSWWEFVASEPLPCYDGRVEIAGENGSSEQQLSMKQNRRIANILKQAKNAARRRVNYLENLEQEGRFKNNFEVAELAGLKTALEVLENPNTPPSEVVAHSEDILDDCSRQREIEKQVFKIDKKNLLEILTDGGIEYDETDPYKTYCVTTFVDPDMPGYTRYYRWNGEY